jgi:hypothetical protein
MSKQDKAAELKAQAEDAQGRGDRDEVRRLLTELAKLNRPERAVAPKKTETRKRG